MDKSEDLSTIVNLEEELVQLGKENFGIINKTLGLTTDRTKYQKLLLKRVNFKKVSVKIKSKLY